MKKIDFNKSWEFSLENFLDEFNSFGFDKYGEATGAAARFYEHSNWERVDIPHDWAVTLRKDLLADTNSGGYPNTRYHRKTTENHSDVDTVYNIGWYRKRFTAAPEWEGKRIFIEFEGIFRDSIIWVNGAYLERHNSGYTGFAIELTEHLLYGEENSIAVRVDCDQPEGWWYDGAGIYRNVNLYICEPIYFKYNQTVIRTELDGRIYASAVLVNDSDFSVAQSVIWSIKDSDGKEVAQAETALELEPYSEEKTAVEMKVDSPNLWSVDTPYLYTLDIQSGKELTSERFGIRTVAFDSDRGFLLNGSPLKIRGACVHQDFGGVGVALTDNLQYYKIKRLKEMGVNAYRGAHHPPSPVLLRACDELGMLVMNETRMFGTSPEAVRQLTELIERDRNHPCVFIWSLGNEENSIQNTERCANILKKATRIAKSKDPTRAVTYGGNNGPVFVGANSASEVRGVNYIRIDKKQTGKWLDVYHQEHPDQPIIGTEDSSYVLSRGGAVNDLGSGLLDSFGDITVPWGSTLKGWVKYSEKRAYFAGSFMWTGFDYRGEPAPFERANYSSSFGTIDLCGIEKPPFYYYKAWWTDTPVLKLAPHWNHKEGDTVTVAVFTNCDEVTLSLNGKALETRRVERFDLPLFEVVYESGVLSVEGRYNGTLLRDELVTSGRAETVSCVSVLDIDNENDIGIYELCAYDANDLPCPLASDEIEITAENGSIVGVCNGDPSNIDYEQKPLEERIRYLRYFNDKNGIFFPPMKQRNALMKGSSYLEREPRKEPFEDDYRMVVRFASPAPKELTRELVTVISDAEEYEYVEFERLDGHAKVYLNGELLGENVKDSKISYRPYRFYGSFKKGDNELKVVFEYSQADEPLMSGYVKIGKRTESPWRVKLHYGKARVFVKSKTPSRLKLTLKALL